jgi:hypothetical protein
MSEPVEPTSAPAPPPAVRPPAPTPPGAPARPLPSQEDIADWIDGAEVPLIGAPFEGLTMARFDALVMQVRKEEAIPQHWQAISDRAVPDDLTFERLPEVGGLRVRYKDQELARRRLAPLRLAWRELAGRRPAMWSVSDLFAAMRRLYEHNAKVDWTDLLTAIRDVWRDLELPHGREQLEVLWTCLAIVRKNTKK